MTSSVSDDVERVGKGVERCELSSLRSVKVDGEKMLGSGRVNSVSVSSGIENGMWTSSRDTPRRTAATRASSLNDDLDDDVMLVVRDLDLRGCCLLGGGD